MSHLPFEYYNLILHTFEVPRLVNEEGVRSFGGINEKWAPEWNGWAHLPEYPSEAYKQLYDFYDLRWKTVKAYMLPDPLSLFYFDFSFNAGGRVACEKLQRVLNCLEPKGDNEEDLDQDGLMGPKTAGMARVHKGTELNVAYLSERIEFYVYLDKPQYLKGWVKRVGKLIEWL